MFVRDSHHENVTIVYTVQNFFGNNQTIIRNSPYKVLFCDPVDDLLLRTISSQLKFPSIKGKSFLVACFDALAAYYPDWQYPYVVIDGCQISAANWFRVKSMIFPEPGKKFIACLLTNPKAREK